MGDPGEARQEVVKPKEDCICPVCDLLRFHYWAVRIRNKLPHGLEEDSPRLALIFEIHETNALRHPLGICERLNEVIGMIHCEEPDADEDAAKFLDDMVADEKSQLVQHRIFEECAEECEVAAYYETHRDKIP